MCLFSINMPDYSNKLNAINGNLHEIAENTKQMGYSLDSIRKDMRRVADASEVVAGIITKEEIQINQAIERIRKTDSVMSGVFDYEDAPAHVQAECDANQLKIEKLYQKLELIKDERENKILRLSGSEEQCLKKSDDWEGYKPAEPLIKDEKIRKAVRAWAECCCIPLVKHYLSNGLSCFICNDEEDNEYCLDFTFCINNLEAEHIYSIVELCGEEEE